MARWSSNADSGVERQAEESYAVHVRLVLADMRPDEVQPRAFADHPVKVLVESVEALAVVRAHRLGLLGEVGVQQSEDIRSEELAATRSGLDLKRSAYESRACAMARSEIWVTVVERCGRISRNPSCESRQNASRTGCRETPQVFGDLCLGQATSRRKVERQDLLVQHLEHLVRDGRWPHRLDNVH
jgi:hypothetical protein